MMIVFKPNFFTHNNDGYCAITPIIRDTMLCATIMYGSSITQTVVIVILYINDPSAGSPTETLLRLLLPRNCAILR
jgi:hypothetical protein